ncbi:SH3 domain-containing protein [Chloroflexi bacterium TSY]|nr:SH3 domain-containing protein [Chloroflexi bacterium TSY]
MRPVIIFFGVVLVLASFTTGITIGSWSDAPFQASSATAKLLDSPSADLSASLEDVPLTAPVQIEVQAKLTTSDNGSQVSAHTIGVNNARVMVNVDEIGQAQARTTEDGNVEVSALTIAGDAQAHVRLPDNNEVVANVVGEGSAQVQIGEGAQSTANQPGAIQTSKMALNESTLHVASQKEPTLTVRTELLNVRTGPGRSYPVRSQVSRGQSIEIIARSPDHRWWQVCCILNRLGWLHVDYVTATGPLDTVAVATDILPPPVPTTAPTSTPPLIVATVEPQWKFELEMITKHTEANAAVIYAWIHEDGRALDGYFLSVTKEGQEVGTNTRSSSIPLGTTKPAFPNHPENKIYNLKEAYTTISHPTLNPVGKWTVQLVDGGRQPVGPPASFVLQSDDPKMEMYVRYRVR